MWGDAKHLFGLPLLLLMVGVRAVLPRQMCWLAGQRLGWSLGLYHPSGTASCWRAHVLVYTHTPFVNFQIERRIRPGEHVKKQ